MDVQDKLTQPTSGSAKDKKEIVVNGSTSYVTNFVFQVHHHHRLEMNHNACQHQQCLTLQAGVVDHV